MANNIYSFTLQTAEISTGTPETVVNDATAKNPLGALMKWNGNLYRYVKFDNGTGNVAAVATGAVTWKTLSPAADTPVYTATSDTADAISALNSVAGILKGVVTDLYFTWIGVGGVHSCKVNAGTPAGAMVIGSATDLTLDHVPNGSSTLGSLPYGTALTAVSSNASDVLLQNMVW